MGGGLMQLVAYGAQDIYLTGNPQITFFKVVYRRHTNFAMEAIQQTFNGTVGLGRKVTCTVSRNGDLVHRMLLEASWANSGTLVDTEAGNSLVKSVELEVGGQRVDKQYGMWMSVWADLSLPAGQSAGYNTMVGKTLSGASGKLYVPLQFWFCRNPGLALPLIALQYHEVKVNLEFAADTAGAFATAAGAFSLTDASLYVDYIYLDTDERRRFAQVSHEYLIEQVQYTGAESVTASAANKVRLNFNHPVKELVWVLRDGSSAENLSKVGDKLTDAKLQLNGHDRFSTRQGSYFNLVQPYQHHSNSASAGVYVYSFALRPEEHQPSGTCNFSRIDNATLNLTLGSGVTEAQIYAVNYNVLRVMSGMGGLAYSN